MYLVDTNIWLERLLDQDKSEEVGRFLDIVKVIEKYNLDFDDAYQYVTATKSNLLLVSFDSDFDRTEGRRKTPEVICTEFKKDVQK